MVSRLEWCEVSVGQWKVVKDNLTEGVCLVDNLVQGETYSFRLISYSLDCSSPDSEPSLPCPPLTVPLGEGQTGSALLALQQRKVDTDPALQTNFEQQYIELEEVQYSTVQYSTVQYSTVQYVQYSTVVPRVFLAHTWKEA